MTTDTIPSFLGSADVPADALDRAAALVEALRAHPFESGSVELVFETVTGPIATLDGREAPVGSRRVATDDTLAATFIAEVEADLVRMAVASQQGQLLPARYALGVWWAADGFVRYAKTVST